MDLGMSSRKHTPWLLYPPPQRQETPCPKPISGQERQTGRSKKDAMIPSLGLSSPTRGESPCSVALENRTQGSPMLSRHSSAAASITSEYSTTSRGGPNSGESPRHNASQQGNLHGLSLNALPEDTEGMMNLSRQLASVEQIISDNCHPSATHRANSMHVRAQISDAEEHSSDGTVVRSFARSVPGTRTRYLSDQPFNSAPTSSCESDEENKQPRELSPSTPKTAIKSRQLHAQKSLTPSKPLANPLSIHGGRRTLLKSPTTSVTYPRREDRRKSVTANASMVSQETLFCPLDPHFHGYTPTVNGSTKPIAHSRSQTMGYLCETDMTSEVWIALTREGEKLVARHKVLLWISLPEGDNNPDVVLLDLDVANAPCLPELILAEPKEGVIELPLIEIAQRFEEPREPAVLNVLLRKSDLTTPLRVEFTLVYNLGQRHIGLWQPLLRPTMGQLLGEYTYIREPKLPLVLSPGERWTEANTLGAGKHWTLEYTDAESPRGIERRSQGLGLTVKQYMCLDFPRLNNKVSPTSFAWDLKISVDAISPHETSCHMAFSIPIRQSQVQLAIRPSKWELLGSRFGHRPPSVATKAWVMDDNGDYLLLKQSYMDTIDFLETHLYWSIERIDAQSYHLIDAGIILPSVLSHGILGARLDCSIKTGQSLTLYGTLSRAADRLPAVLFLKASAEEGTICTFIENNTTFPILGAGSAYKAILPDLHAIYLSSNASEQSQSADSPQPQDVASKQGNHRSYGTFNAVPEDGIYEEPPIEQENTDACSDDSTLVSPCTLRQPPPPKPATKREATANCVLTWFLIVVFIGVAILLISFYHIHGNEPTSPTLEDLTRARAEDPVTSLQYASPPRMHFHTLVACKHEHDKGPNKASASTDDNLSTTPQLIPEHKVPQSSVDEETYMQKFRPQSLRDRIDRALGWAWLAH